MNKPLRWLPTTVFASFCLLAACVKHELPGTNVPIIKPEVVDTTAIKDSVRRQQITGTYIGSMRDYLYNNGVITDTTFTQSVYVIPWAKDSISITIDGAYSSMALHFLCRDSITVYVNPRSWSPVQNYESYVFPASTDSLNYIMRNYPSGANWGHELSFRGRKM